MVDDTGLGSSPAAEAAKSGLYAGSERGVVRSIERLLASAAIGAQADKAAGMERIGFVCAVRAPAQCVYAGTSHFQLKHVSEDLQRKNDFYKTVTVRVDWTTAPPRVTASITVTRA